MLKSTGMQLISLEHDVLGRSNKTSLDITVPNELERPLVALLLMRIDEIKDLGLTTKSLKRLKSRIRLQTRPIAPGHMKRQ